MDGGWNQWPQKKLSEELVTLWIAGTWRETPEEMIEWSFVKCGVINNLDYTQNDLQS